MHQQIISTNFVKLLSLLINLLSLLIKSLSSSIKLLSTSIKSLSLLIKLLNSSVKSLNLLNKSSNNIKNNFYREVSQWDTLINKDNKLAFKYSVQDQLLNCEDYLNYFDKKHKEVIIKEKDIQYYNNIYKQQKENIDLYGSKIELEAYKKEFNDKIFTYSNIIIFYTITKTILPIIAFDKEYYNTLEDHK